MLPLLLLSVGCSGSKISCFLRVNAFNVVVVDFGLEGCDDCKFIKVLLAGSLPNVGSLGF